MPLEPIKILAVDDIEENLTALEALLKRDDIALIKARSGSDALEALLEHDVALALVDVQMPVMDGFELAELMRGTDRTRRIPIIFVTAVATDERRTFRGYEAGAVDYLFKPVDPHIVRSKVEIFVALFRQRQELERQRDEHAAALARLNAHQDNSPLAIVEIGADGRILGWSNGAERLFGWRASEVAGFRPDELQWLDADHVEAFAALIDALIAGHQPRATHDLRMRNSVGLVLECACYCSALLDRTGRLASINLQILDVTERKRAEETQRLLIGELNHRVRNTLASVQAIATQTLRYSAGPSDFAPTFIGRINSLARAHSLLSGSTWQGAGLRDIVEGQIQTGTIDPAQLQIDGPDLELPPEPSLHLALVIHEVVTNAYKYGALSVPDGRVALNWEISGEVLELTWRESGGPPVKAPSRRGFGTELIERSLRAEGGAVETDYAPTGVTLRLTLPIKSVAKAGQRADRVQLRIAELRRADEGGEALCLAGMRVLIIEDEPLVGLEIADMLAAAGAEPIGPISNLADALAQVGIADVDAALLDGNLQGETVDEIALALRQHGRPFLFVSGYGRENLPAGFDDIPLLTKPFDLEQLSQTLKGLRVPARNAS